MNDKLVEISKLMREQGNRSTQYPLFVIQSLKKHYVGRDGDYTGVSRIEDVDIASLCESCSFLSEEGTELPENCDDCDSEGFCYFREEYEIDNNAGVFLTEKACEEHIEANSYHYNSPKSYVISAWRNAEMVSVMHYLLSLTEGEIPSHYR